MAPSEIRRLSDEEAGPFAAIALNAYPAFEIASPEELATRLRQGLAEDPTTSLYGLFREGRMLGGMRLHDFTMQFAGTQLPVGGVGMVAVDLLHKKEHVAKELISFYVRHYREGGVPLAALYPFRPDFYRRMGFGYGTPMRRYCLRPQALPRRGDKRAIVELGRDDAEAILACYGRCFEQTHGLFARSAAWAGRAFSNSANRFFGYRRNGQLEGYLVFTFRRGKNFLINDIEVSEMLYEHPEALYAMLAFLQSQLDQINEVVIDSQDDYFYYLLEDVRNGSANLIPSVYHESHVAGIGLMYRLIDTPGFFRTLAGHNFGGVSYTLALEVEDSFLPENAGRTVVRFSEGRPELLPGDAPADVTISLEIGDLSALVVGAVDYTGLHRLGLSSIADPARLMLVDATFRIPRRPICLTRY